MNFTSPSRVVLSFCVAALLSADSLPAAPAEEVLTFARSYTTTAYISFLGIPIFSRSGVGSGFASLEQRTHAKQSAMILRFLSASDPARAHGLNRFGFIQEEIKQQEGAYIEGRYLGLMTASKEETLADAKQAINKVSGNESAFVAAQGALTPHSFHYSLRRMVLPTSSAGVSGLDAMIRRVESEFSSTQAPEREATTNAQTPQSTTFLWAICHAIQSADPKSRQRFTYNGSNFELRINKQEDLSVGQAFARSGLVSSASDVMALDGSIVNDHGNQTSAFRLWFDKTSANVLPLRFEMRPKSYLRLVYDLSPVKTNPSPKAVSLNRSLPE